MKKHPLLLLTLLIIFAYAPLFLSDGFIGDFGDPIGQTIPNKILLTEYLKNGILPLWNSFSFLGFPFLADIQVGAFYLPDLIIFSIFSPFQAHNISLLLHSIFAATGIFLLLKNLSKNNLIAFTLSTVFVLTAPLISRVVYLNFFETISYLPWIILALKSHKKIIPKLAILIALMIFAGHPIAAFYSFLIIFIYLARDRFKNWLKISAGIILGILISIIQLLPFLNLKSQSVRDSLSYQEFIEGSINPESLSTFISPFKIGLENPFDTYLHFGTIAFILLLVSPFLFKKFTKKFKKLYITGATLCIIGFLLSLGGALPPLAKTLHQIPFFNIIRVPARYIIIFHFGAILCLTSFFTYLFRKRKNIATILSILIILNSILLPSIFLDRHKIVDAQAQYFPEIKTTIEKLENENFSLTSPPSYFLSSSFFLFPNRHIPNFMPNIIGYNPLILENFHKTFPISPVGSFENPNYFTDQYQILNNIGLKYYIFPTEKFLKDQNLEEKTSVINFLNENNWEKIATFDNLEIWKSPNPKPFAYFQNEENTITNINFQPGKIELQTNVKSNDQLIINQIHTKDWQMKTDKNSEITPSKPFQKIIQSYNVTKDTKSIMISYKPKTLYYGLFLSIIGILITIVLLSFPHKNEKKSNS